MIDKVKAFPIEDYYFLESEDFLIHRAKFYFKKDKRIKLNSYWIGLSKLRVNNDKMLYLFNGLRGYYDVRSRYFKDPKIMKKKVPLSKLTFINDYLVKKYKFSDLFIYSLKNFNRPTIRLAKEGNAVYYSFPYKLTNYLNRKAEVKIARENNRKFSQDVRVMKNIGLRFYLSPRRRMKGYKRAQLLPGISLGFGEIFLLQHIKFLKYFHRIKQKINNRIFEQKAKYKRRRIRKFDLFYKASVILKFLARNSKRKFRIIRLIRRLNKRRKNLNKNKIKKSSGKVQGFKGLFSTGKYYKYRKFKKVYLKKYKILEKRLILKKKNNNLKGVYLYKKNKIVRGKKKNSKGVKYKISKK